MKANYGSYIPISTVDWHGKAAVVLFLRGCPFRCPYCQNYEILTGSDLVEMRVLQDKIESSTPFISSLVISGGEPLIQKKAVKELASFAKKKGLLVGIHTNGFYPEVIEELLQKSLVDAFFLDIKAPMNDPIAYCKVIGCDEYNLTLEPKEVIEDIAKSLDLISKSNAHLEVRTTVIPGLVGSKEDIAAIGQFLSPYIKDSDKPYVIQQGLPENAMSENLRDTKPFTRKELIEMAKAAYPFLHNVWIRTKEAGNERINFEFI
ncbi:MAG: pyruvate formate lyase-activating enzyme 1 [Methanomethylovorans sp. PtaU1.Bin093]|jgi:pyruvate formate lyase activating enzyme|uniref:anaerobic ribonucleoside-triphosphate reductase activating protein n=1 Tax=Methanomethylovorans sp. PtaU1.Bin093 TaxID=1811679 RepID=UPI0009C935C4|nr:anaerobic ribonucleoside-triphosphate reductase activating protein [Methanomethylovorans sp. PtaU1.Bin093]OPY21189.1 MAG: pyruvate formate lyase-activating enzyme 1 [Methanomethylovorans sp. PtaU1.Bin093]